MVPDDLRYQKYKTPQLDWTTKSRGRYRFMLLHNDFPRITGRLYQKLSPYHRSFVEGQEANIMANISKHLKINSSKGVCTLHTLTLQTFASVPIQQSLRGPGHLIQAQFNCPGKATQISNTMIPLMEFDTLGLSRITCGHSQILKADSQHTFDLRSTHCFAQESS